MGVILMNLLVTFETGSSHLIKYDVFSEMYGIDVGKGGGDGNDGWHIGLCCSVVL